jgi:DNA ligase (NAD+)
MGIRQLGESAAKELSRIHRDLKQIAESPVLAELLRDGRADAKKKNDLLIPYAISPAMSARPSLGIDPQSDNYLPIAAEADTSALPLHGKTFVITGTLSRDRDAIKEQIERMGGKVSGSVSAKTSYLLAGEGGGSKRDKAEALGVKIISEQELAEWIAEPPV